MSDHSYNYPAPLWQNMSVRPEFQATRIGMMVAGMASAAENLHAFRQGKKSQPEAIGDTLRTTLYAGASATVADYVHRQMGSKGLGASLVALSSGAAMMYLLVKNDDRLKDIAKRKKSDG